MNIAAYTEALDACEGCQRGKRNGRTGGGAEAVQEQNRFLGRPAQGDLMPFSRLPMDRCLEERESGRWRPARESRGEFRRD